MPVMVALGRLRQEVKQEGLRKKDPPTTLSSRRTGQSNMAIRNKVSIVLPLLLRNKVSFCLPSRLSHFWFWTPNTPWKASSPLLPDTRYTFELSRRTQVPEVFLSKVLETTLKTLRECCDTQDSVSCFSTQVCLAKFLYQWRRQNWHTEDQTCFTTSLCMPCKLTRKTWFVYFCTY